ncbi:MAG: glycosyltransferase [Pseudomonadales bacterium]|nr:glycosyltransferase [Pseudomonadales bacterium]
MTVPAVSIIIPAYNAARYLPETLKSVQAQDFKDFEVILVDNGSTDETLSIANAAAKADRRIQVHANGVNKGYVFNLNRGLELARGAYIAYLHADDLWQPNFLSSSLAHLKAHPEAGLCFCRFNNIDSQGAAHSTAPRNAVDGPSRPIERADLFAMYLGRDFTPVCTVLATRAAYEACGPYDPQYPGPCDYQMWLKMAHQFGGVYNADSTSKYRIHGGSGTEFQADRNFIMIEQYSMVHKLFDEVVAVYIDVAL